MTQFEQAVMEQQRDERMPSEESMLRAKLGVIIVAYDRAMADPQARIPTVLHAAIEAARRG